jgi:hypothetical protein
MRWDAFASECFELAKYLINDTLDKSVAQVVYSCPAMTCLCCCCCCCYCCCSAAVAVAALLPLPCLPHAQVAEGGTSCLLHEKYATNGCRAGDITTGGNSVECSNCATNAQGNYTCADGDTITVVITQSLVVGTPVVLLQGIAISLCGAAYAAFHGPAVVALQL